VSGKEVRFVELFAGIGGFRLGLERANQARRGAESRELRWENLRLQRNQPDGHRANGRAKHPSCGMEAEQPGAEGGLEAAEKHDSDARGEDGDRRRQRTFRCVWANDVDKWACAVYRRRFGSEEIVEGDIRQVDPSEIPGHDLLTAGFPCQSFSVAGKRRGFNDTRGTLFFEIARVLNEKRPRHFLLENVRGLLSHESGKTFQTVLRVLTDLGYLVQWEVLNSKHFGVPQNRERIFIVGHLARRLGGGREVFPICGNRIQDDGAYQAEQGGGKRVRDSDQYARGYSENSEGQRQEVRRTGNSDKQNLRFVGGIGEPDWEAEKGRGVKPLSRNFKQGRRVYDATGLAQALSSAGVGSVGGATGVYAICDSGLHRKKQVRTGVLPPLRSGRGCDRSDTVQIVNVGNLYPSRGENGQVLDPVGVSRALKSGVTDNPKNRGIGSSNAPKIAQYGSMRSQAPQRWDEAAHTVRQDLGRNVLKPHNPVLLPNLKIRRLTPVECERLQGFPDGWTARGIMGGREVAVSDTQRYKLLGNAVTVNVVEAIGTRMMEVLF